MDTNDFYEDDESLEDVRNAWRAGEPGTTDGPNALSEHHHLIASQAAESLKTIYVDASGWFGAPQGFQVSGSDAITRELEFTNYG